MKTTAAGLPELRTPIPGPRSRDLARRLALVESPNITSLEPDPPIFWERAAGANVFDADGNRFIDLTAGFGVTHAGHAQPGVVQAIQHQVAQLPHALGDVHPAAIKVELLERLHGILPEPLRVSILANTGAEAVEAALKTAVMHTGRTGVLAFQNSYHGLTYGALSVTHRALFRAPFEAQLQRDVVFAPFVTPSDVLDNVMHEIDALLAANDIGAIIVEPVQGRGGLVVPHENFLTALRARCDGVSRLLIFDEVYTGIGRTGRWLACEHWNVVPDVVVLGKALGGSLPISVCTASRTVMASWPTSSGEAIHTSTFLGNPVACAAAIAQIDAIQSEGLLERARDLGAFIRDRVSAWGRPARGIGLLQGVVAANAIEICNRCLADGVLVLAEGTRADVIAITPPAVISEPQLDFALRTIERHLR